MDTMITLQEKETTTITPIHPATRMGHVSLTVSHLGNQIAFYQQALGFVLHWREGNQASLGTGARELLRLVQQPNARPHERVTGLYHYAVLYPDRRELARAMARLFARNYQNYPTDHVMTKSTYLGDPEGNGIELYAESPKDGWMGVEDGEFIVRRTDGTWSNGREALDLDALMGHLHADDRLDGSIPQETRIGHVHLHVRDVDEAVGFYHGILGFDVMGSSKAMRVAFVSAGGYHHHMGLNTWKGEGAPSPPPDAAGLRYLTVVLPSTAELDKVLARLQKAGVATEQREDGLLVRDPSQNAVLLIVGERSPQPSAR
jgi:catechol 2,3-dioxygenase